MFKCIECEYYSQRCYNVQRHMLIKHNLTISCKNILDKNVTILDKNVTICKDCNKTYSSVTYLKKHKCKGIINKFDCKYCKKQLASFASKSRHQSSCKYKDEQTTINNNTINNDNSTNIQIDNLVVTNNITINNFGNENLTYISDEMLQALTNNVDARGMIDVIYFNDSHPENHNIELYSNKKQLYKIYKNNSFSNVMNIDLAHNQMICKMVKLFMDKILEEEDMDQKNSKLHNLHYYNKTKSETVKLLSKHIYSQILSRTLQKIDF